MVHSDTQRGNSVLQSGSDNFFGGLLEHELKHKKASSVAMEAVDIILNPYYDVEITLSTAGSFKPLSFLQLKSAQDQYSRRYEYLHYAFQKRGEKSISWIKLK